MAAMAHTTITERDEEKASRALAAYYKRLYLENRELIFIAAMLGIGLYINRKIIRSELRKIQFSAEFFPDDYIDDYLIGIE